MSSLQTLQQLEELRALIQLRANAAIDRSFALGGPYALEITEEQRLESELEQGKYTAYKIAGEELDKLISSLKKAQTEEAANV